MIFFLNSKNYFMNTIRVSNCLDPDQALHIVRPDLGLNCLQSAEKKDAVAGKELLISYV